MDLGDVGSGIIKAITEGGDNLNLADGKDALASVFVHLVTVHRTNGQHGAQQLAHSLDALLDCLMRKGEPLTKELGMLERMTLVGTLKTIKSAKAGYNAETQEAAPEEA